MFEASQAPLGSALDCPSEATCLLGGLIGRGFSNQTTGAIEQEVHGRWLPVVTGLGVSGRYVNSRVTAIACHLSTLCIAGGETGNAKGNLSAPFAQAEVDGHWLRPVIMPDLGGLKLVSLWRTGAACTNSSCSYFAELTGGKSWNATVLATFSQSKWSYSLVRIDGSSSGVDVTGVSCVVEQCWVAGTSPGNTGFVSLIASS